MKRWMFALLAPLSLALGQVVTPFQPRFGPVNERGDILLIGNTLMCMSAWPFTSCDTNWMGNPNSNNTAISGGQFDPNRRMIFVNADPANPTWPSGRGGSSSATLTLPSDAEVLWAGLYWGARARENDAGRNTIYLKAPGSSLYQTITGTVLGTITTNFVSGNNTYRPYVAFADVTSIVRTSGVGTYWVGGIRAQTGNDLLGYYAGWSLVVVYRSPSATFKNLVVYDGLAVVSSLEGFPSATITPSGFLTPLVGPVTARLGAVAFEGDGGITGDQLRVNGSALSDSQNPSNNFFNSSVSDLEVRFTNKSPDFLNQLGIDVDRVDATGKIPNGATSANLEFYSQGDAFFPAVLTFAVDLYLPDLITTFTKNANDLNGGQVSVGDILEYTISFTNTGTDGATNVTVLDPLPAGTQYVPGSLQVVQNAPGAPTGGMTDQSGDDIAEYSPSCPELSGSPPCVRFRLGTGANASQGGVFLPSQGAEVRFRVQVLPSAAGQNILNTARVDYNSLTLGTSYSQTAQAQVSVTVEPPQPPSLSKAFSPDTIAVGGVSVLTLTLSNPNNYPATLTADLVDQLPNGLVVANPANASTTCPGGVLTANPGSGTITLHSGAQIPAGGACTLTVEVTSNAPGTYTNTLPAGALQTDLGNSQSPASAVLSVTGYAVTGYLYHDTQPNGMRDPGEDWQTGTTVWVKLVQGSVVVAVAQVDPGTGTFQFQGVAPGSYLLLVDDNNDVGDTVPTPPSGWLFVNPPTGSLSLTVSGNTSDLLFGLFHGSVVQGRVFWDHGLGGGTANDAWQNGGEPGVGNVEVRATDGTNTRITLTDGTGYYRLYLPASWGTVTLTHPLRPATGYNDGSTATKVASWQAATAPNSPGATVSLGPASSLAGGVRERNFGVVGDSRFYPDGSGQTSSPGVYTFSHWYRPGTLGDVTLDLASPPTPRYTYQVRVDGDCDGSFGPGEDWTSLPYTFPVGGSWPREPEGSLKACRVEVRVLVPAGEPMGATDIALVEARLAWSGNPGVQEPDSLTDTVQVTGGEVRLEKRVRNVTQNTPFAATGQGKPGDVLEYCIAYRNLGTQPVGLFTLSDPVPFFTDPLTSVADYGGKAIRWTHAGATQYLTAQTGDDAGEMAGGLVRVEVGSVGPGESGEVCYRVKVR
ncbi:DUF3344 domain-containing protein [Thermus amyloliquefaciens]|uniref:DUF7933 domain-containing protein n=1 Tax=Thermus amyloliquefaciens TaxID=1449080 RepID=UPI0005703D40|nr:DUF3344 domain-containing protein [Thermus amyloliquefaciens]